VSRSTLQHRLTITVVSVSIGAVAVAGLLTAAAARRATRNEVAAEMEREVSAFANLAAATAQRCGRPAKLQAFARNEQAGLAFLRNGRVVRETGDIRFDLLDANALASGAAQTVIRPRFIVVAKSLGPCPVVTPVFVLQRPVGGGVGPIGGGLVLAGAIAAVLAAAVAYGLSRRLTRPIASLQRAAQTMATGDLSARVVITDDTPDELATLAATVNDLAIRLDEARGLERAFLMSISHDLRTPLTSIRGYAEAIAEGAVESDEARQRAVAVIGQEGRRLERLVADLLDLARLDAREFSLRLDRHDIVPLVRTAAEAFIPAAAEAGVTLTTDLPSKALAVADPDRLGQVVGNLVENALKFAAANIAVSVRATGAQSVELAVTDDGPGIAAEDLPHVFDRLYTSRRGAARSVGTGLGLAIVRELTTAMGGHVRAEAASGGGSRMVVSLAAGPSHGS
jgi:two-component system sensor histidine kinase BaeS